MKRSILFLSVAICISMTQKVIAQSNAQITKEELKSLYENGEYKKAITYIEQFKYTKDGSPLIILGDCCWKESYIEEQQSNQSYNQSLMTQSMAISQGLYYDNSFMYLLYQQIQQRVLQLRLQTVDLYSRAAKLGDNAGNQRVAVLNSILGNNSTGTNYTPTYSESSNSQFQTKTKKCVYCNGTGECYLCNKAGQSKACVQNQFGVTCSDSYCIARNHRCKDCGGTHVCQYCKGTGSR